MYLRRRPSLKNPESSARPFPRLVRETTGPPRRRTRWIHHQLGAPHFADRPSGEAYIECIW